MKILPGAPSTQAKLFRIWQICQPVEWNLTAAQIADQMGDIEPNKVGNLLSLAGWQNRVRASKTDRKSNGFNMQLDAEAAAIAKEFAG